LFAIPLSARVLGPSAKLRRLRLSIATLGSMHSFTHQKFQVAFWQATAYSVLFIYGCWTLNQERDWLSDYAHYACKVTNVSWKVALYYHLTISYYIYALYLLIFVDHRLKDFAQMVVHHLITLFLTLGSYYWIFRIHIGIIVMILHDMADPYLHIAKMFKYSKSDTGANIFFSVFALVFIASRCVIYPIFVIHPLL
jgi:hypothetical protein